MILSQEHSLVIYTDGACSVNKKIGGWGVYVNHKGQEFKLSGSEKETTNNQMELYAFLIALKFVRDNITNLEKAVIYTDSAYVFNCIDQKWYLNWYKNGWKVAGKNKSIKNIDLWKQILFIYEQLENKLIVAKTQGHMSIRGNEIADELAVAAKAKLMEELYV